jgi:hypothetical protein
MEDAGDLTRPWPKAWRSSIHISIIIITITTTTITTATVEASVHGPLKLTLK